MGNHLFAVTNLAQTATLTTGTGGSAPARDETSPYTMEKAQNASRLSFWKSASSPAANVYFDLDFGSSKSVSIAAVLGYRAATAGAVGTVVVSSSGTASYPRTWVSRGTFSMSGEPRDNGATFNTVTARYWRFDFPASYQFQVARVFLGATTDLEGAGLPGGLTSPYQTRNEQPLLGGGVLIETLGDPGREFTISFGPATQARRQYFEDITNASGSLVLVDPEGHVYEVYAPGGRTEQARRFYANSTGSYDLSVRLMRMP